MKARAAAVHDAELAISPRKGRRGSDRAVPTRALAGDGAVGCARFFGYRTLGGAEAASDHASTEGWIDGDKIPAEEDALRRRWLSFLRPLVTARVR